MGNDGQTRCVSSSTLDSHGLNQPTGLDPMTHPSINPNYIKLNASYPAANGSRWNTTTSTQVLSKEFLFLFFFWSPQQQQPNQFICKFTKEIISNWRRSQNYASYMLLVKRPSCISPPPPPRPTPPTPEWPESRSWAAIHRRLFGCWLWLTRTQRHSPFHVDIVLLRRLFPPSLPSPPCQPLPQLLFLLLLLLLLPPPQSPLTIPISGIDLNNDVTAPAWFPHRRWPDPDGNTHWILLIWNLVRHKCLEEWWQNGGSCSIACQSNRWISVAMSRCGPSLGPASRW